MAKVETYRLLFFFRKTIIVLDQVLAKRGACLAKGIISNKRHHDSCHKWGLLMSYYCLRHHLISGSAGHKKRAVRKLTDAKTKRAARILTGAKTKKELQEYLQVLRQKKSCKKNLQLQ
ncbi:hypothetical protein [Butyrivibrio sp. JL13D10]|uniref:hypothetical protein n=1 Tax=Butyrivibrio sp. JL13D10 TaxID=3236815 RepID=UPI0038B675AB